MGAQTTSLTRLVPDNSRSIEHSLQDEGLVRMRTDAALMICCGQLGVEPGVYLPRGRGISGLSIESRNHRAPPVCKGLAITQQPDRSSESSRHQNDIRGTAQPVGSRRACTPHAGKGGMHPDSRRQL